MMAVSHHSMRHSWKPHSAQKFHVSIFYRNKQYSYSNISKTWNMQWERRWLRHFAHFFPHFNRGVKVWNLASVWPSRRCIFETKQYIWNANKLITRRQLTYILNEFDTVRFTHPWELAIKPGERRWLNHVHHKFSVVPSIKLLEMAMKKMPRKKTGLEDLFKHQ